MHFKLCFVRPDSNSRGFLTFQENARRPAGSVPQGRFRALWLPEQGRIRRVRFRVCLLIPPYFYQFIFPIPCRCLSKFGFKLVSGLERDLIDSITHRSSRLVHYEDFVDALRVDIKYVPWCVYVGNGAGSLLFTYFFCFVACDEQARQRAG